jgi:SAM-dependent methyltransferase
MEEIFTDGYIYDLLYSKKDYEREAEYLSQLIKEYNSGKNLLEFGCGHGKHAKFLIKNFAFSIHGIEQSHQMISRIENIKGFTYEQGDIADITVDRKFDTVFSLFCVMSYQTTNNKIEKIFINANKHLIPGGVFIFDFWFTPAVYNNFPSIKFKKVTNEKFEVSRVAEPVIYSTENRVDVNYTFFVKDLISNKIKSYNELHKMRHFGLLEIDLFCKITGFERVFSKEYITNNPLNENTWNAIVVLKKL